MAGRDWARLPSPLLCSVAERLTPVTYIRVRTACTDWASAVSPEEWEEGQQQPYYLPRSLHCPWLLVPSEQDEPGGFCTFLSLPESLRPYRIVAPELRDKYIVGSHGGWFAAVDTDCNAFLINPLVRAQIPLPSLTTLTIPRHRVEVVRDPSSGSPVEFLLYGCYGGPVNYTPERFRMFYFRKIIFSSNPTSCPGDFIVVVIYHDVGYLAFARAGDTAWTVLDMLPPNTYGYFDAVFVDRKLYAVADTGQIDAFDFTHSKPQPEVVAEKIMCRTAAPRYLVFSSGDLLHVKRLVQDDDLPPKTSCFTVEKIDLAGQGENNRVPVKDLGLQSLFLGANQSLSISTEDISGVRHNCIYFTDHYVDWFLDEGKAYPRDMGIFDIKEEVCEALYPPDTWLTWPPPVWFAPVLK